MVHPPVGKWVIGLGERLFGFNPFGWRFMVALLGTLSVLMLCRIGRRLFRSTFLGCLAGALMAVDGLHFVMSRTALLDLVLMFFVLAAFGCLLSTGTGRGRRLAAALPVGREDGCCARTRTIAETAAAGLAAVAARGRALLGLAFGTKWNGLYILVAFGLMTVLWDVGARRTAGARQPVPGGAPAGPGLAFVSTVPVAIGTYIASWTGWFLSGTTATGGYYRDWADRPTAGAAAGPGCRTGCAACGTTSTRSTSSTSA